MHSLPDPERVGGPGWLARTGGRLTWRDRLPLLAASLRTTASFLLEQLAPRSRSAVDLDDAFAVPDSRLARRAEEAAREQSPGILGHAYRTAIFGRALSIVDGVKIDPELLYVAALLHDAGLGPAVAREDFTLRSAAVARKVCDECGRADDGVHVADAICVHTTAGVAVEKDGALGCYIQFGAMVDLVGLRERNLPYAFVRRAVDAHPRDAVKKEILRAFREETSAVPCGRFGFLRYVGFPLLVQTARVPSRKW